MTEKQKILVSGNVNGKFSILFNRIDALNAKVGPFECLFCVGDFFGSAETDWLPYKTGEIKVPILTYILGPNLTNHIKYYPNHDNCELCPNVYYLGQCGLFTTKSGLNVAYLSGVEDANKKDICCITQDHINSVQNDCIKGPSILYSGVDILLTSCWPEGATKFDEQTSSPKGSLLVSQLATMIKPRYHFCGTASQFYERPPYRNVNTGDRVHHVTRLVALADVGNKNKLKWLYAFNISPLQSMKASELAQETTNTTMCPYSFKPPEERTQQYFFDLNSTDDDYTNTNKRKHRNDHKGLYANKRDVKMTVNQDDCWFCIASNKFEKHLVINISDEVYLTLAKGPLVGGHVIIVPITHQSTISEMTDTTKNEIKKLKSTLAKMYADENKTAVYFERNYKSPHTQLHVVPIPTNKSTMAKKMFLRMAEEKGYDLTELPDNMALEDIVTDKSQYFYVELEDAKLIHIIKKKYFPLQFGRDVLANEKILNLPDKIDWKKCELSKDDEINMVEKLRNKFKSAN